MSSIRVLPVNRNIAEGTLTEKALGDFYGSQFREPVKDYVDRIELEIEVSRLMHIPDPYGPGAGPTYSGFYFPAQRTLALMGGEIDTLGLFAEATLAHEYVHSFQDRAFGAEILNESGADLESQEVIVSRCIKEGDASFAAQLYMNEVRGEGWQRKAALQTQAPATSSTAMQAGPSPLHRYLYLNYVECPRFISAIHELGGWDAVNALYRNLPKTTEQVLHPAKYLADEKAKDVPEIDLSPVLGSGWQLKSSRVFGEFDVLVYLYGLTRNDQAARTAAGGWDGGSMSVYISERGETLVHISLLWDSSFEFGDFKREYERAVLRITGTRGTISAAQPVWSWQTSPSEFGYARWDLNGLRADIVLGNDQTSINSAQGVIQTSGSGTAPASCYEVKSPEDRLEVIEAGWPPALGQPLVARVRYNLDSHDSATLVLFPTQATSPVRLQDANLVVERGAGEITVTALPNVQSSSSVYVLQMNPPRSITPVTGGACVIPIVSMQFNAATPR